MSLLNALIRTEPANTQAIELRKTVKKQMTRKGMMGLGLLGGAAAIVGGIVVAALALKK